MPEKAPVVPANPQVSPEIGGVEPRPLERPTDKSIEGLDMMIRIIAAPAYFFYMESHRLLSVNQPFAELMEYSESELLDMTLEDLRTPEEVPKLLRALNQTPPQGSVRWRYLTRTGVILHVNLAYRNSLYFDRITSRRHPIRLVVLSSWDHQSIGSSDKLFGMDPSGL